MNEDEEQQQQGRTIESAVQSFQSSIHKLLHRYQKRLHVNNITNDNNDNENDNENGNHNECNSHRDDDESFSKEAVKKIISECNYLALHSNHIFRMLHSKRQSLKLALNAFGATSKELVDIAALAASKAGNVGNNVAKDVTDFIELIERILRHWFAMYIRLRDGFVLLESGERRHPGDDADGEGNCNFESRLSRSDKLDSRGEYDARDRRDEYGSYRSDGVTRKFSSSKGYTGYGWDEFFDEDLGIQKRLLNGLLTLSTFSTYAVGRDDRINRANRDNRDNRNNGGIPSIRPFSKEKRSRLWDKLLESGCALWDSLMDLHRIESQHLRTDLFDVAKSFVEGMNAVLRSYYSQNLGHMGNVGNLGGKQGGDGRDRKGQFINDRKLKDDKSEMLSWGLWEVRREGNVFAVKDPGGSLPIGFTFQDWRNKFHFGSTGQRANRTNRANDADNNAMTTHAKIAMTTDAKRARSDMSKSISKKRRILDDDSSDEEREDNARKGPPTCEPEVQQSIPSKINSKLEPKLRPKTQQRVPQKAQQKVEQKVPQKVEQKVQQKVQQKSQTRMQQKSQSTIQQTIHRTSSLPKSRGCQSKKISSRGGSVRKVDVDSKIGRDGGDRYADGDGLLVGVRRATNATHTIDTDTIDIDVTNEIDLNNDRIGEKNCDMDGNDLSLDEIKRQHGTSSEELGRSYHQLSLEQMHSSRAANEEELLDGLGIAAYGGNDENDMKDVPNVDDGKDVYGGKDEYYGSAPKLHECLKQWNGLKSQLQNLTATRMLLEEEEMNELVEEWHGLLFRWKECSKEWHGDCRLVKSGRLDKCCDKVYSTREDLREANMLLGNYLLKFSDWLHHRLQLLQKQQRQQPLHPLQPLLRRNTIATIAPPLLSSLSATAHSFLAAAQEAFEMALQLVLEHESCQAASTQSTESTSSARHTPYNAIQQPCDDKAMHLLLRGRAQTNIGIALFRQSETYLQNFELQNSISSANSGNAANSCANGSRRSHQNHRGKMMQEKVAKVNRAIELRNGAVEKLRSALDSARKVRHNSVGVVALSSHRSEWNREAKKRHWESIGLTSLASFYCGICLWKLGRHLEAGSVFSHDEYEVPSDILRFDGVEDVSNGDIIRALGEEYWNVMEMVKLADRTLEAMPVVGPAAAANENETKGEEILELVRRATQRACQISDALYEFAKRHSGEVEGEFEEGKDNSGLIEDVAVRSAIELQERAILEVWRRRIERSRRSLSSRSDNSSAAGSGIASGRLLSARSDLAGNIGIDGNDNNNSNNIPPRRIYLRADGNPLFHARPFKNNDTHDHRKDRDRAAIDAFHSVDWPTEEPNTSSDPNKNQNCNPSASNSTGNKEIARMGYRKWGNEVIPRERRKKYPSCCPPLPLDMDPEIRRVLEVRLGDVLLKMTGVLAGNDGEEGKEVG